MIYPRYQLLKTESGSIYGLARNPWRTYLKRLPGEHAAQLRNDAEWIRVYNFELNSDGSITFEMEPLFTTTDSDDRTYRTTTPIVSIQDVREI